MVFLLGYHLMADTLEELHAFAQTIGLKRSWFRNHPRAPHYDLVRRTKKSKQNFWPDSGFEPSLCMHAKAVKAGAVMLERQDAFKRIKTARKRGWE